MIVLFLFLCFALYCVYEVLDATPSTDFYIDCKEQKETAKELQRLSALRHRGE